MIRKLTVCMAVLIILSAANGYLTVHAADPILQSAGQTLYVPVYSHVYYGDKGRRINLTVTLSIRNTDPGETMTVTSVKYFDTEGKLLREYLESPLNIKPLSATRFLVDESDIEGGSGASFIVRWVNSKDMNEPIVQGVMIGAMANQGISFLTEGRAMPGPAPE
jgi:hypothetical protein